MVADAQPRAGGPRVADDVRQPLLDDAVGGAVDAVGQRPRCALHPQIHTHTGLIDTGEELTEVVETRCGSGGVEGLGVGRAQDPEQEPHLLHDGAARAFDDAQGIAGLVGLGVDEHARDAGADGDHAHGVGERVMQFAGDVYAFFDGGLPDPLLAFGFAFRGAFGLRLLVHAALASVLAYHPAAEHQEQPGAQSAGYAAGRPDERTGEHHEHTPDQQGEGAAARSDRRHGVHGKRRDLYKPGIGV